MSAYDLRDANVGDLVAVQGSGWSRFSVEKRTVKRVTATQVTLDDNTRWTRSGRKVGAGRDRFSSSFAKPWDEKEHVARMEQTIHDNLARDVDGVNWRALSTDQLRRVKAIVGEGK